MDKLQVTAAHVVEVNIYSSYKITHKSVQEGFKLAAYSRQPVIQGKREVDYFQIFGFYCGR